jgi:hypothetical protein
MNVIRAYESLVKPMHKKKNKGTRRMPRHKLPTKDVAICEKLRWADDKLWPVDIRMGKPGPSQSGSRLSEYIG